MKMKVKLILVMMTSLLSAQVFAATVTLDGTWHTGSPNGTPSLSDPNSDSFTWGTDGSATETADKGVLWSYFPDQPLVDDGDTIILSFTVTPVDAGATGYYWRFGLFNSGGTQVLNNLSGSNSDDGFLDTLGYFSSWDQGGSYGTDVYLHARTGGKTAPLSNTSLVENINHNTDSIVLQQGTAYEMSFTVTRNSATEYFVAAAIDDTVISGTTNNINATSFDMFAIQNTPTGIDSFEFSGFKVMSVKSLTITGQPEDLFVSEGESASLTVVALNPFTGDDTGLSYQWYHGLPGDITNPVGTDSATYSIGSVADSDKGNYYCVVTLITDGQTAESQAAGLLVKRLLAHYAFDGDITDSAGTNDGTAGDGGPDFEAGEINQAAKFYGNRYVDIGTSAYPAADPNEGQLGLNTGTISFWFNSGATTGCTVIGSANTGTSQLLNVIFVYPKLRLSIRDVNGATRTVAIEDTTVLDAQWHHAAFVYSTGPQTTVAGYIDGESRDLSIVSGNNGNPQTFTDWEFPLWIGMFNSRGTGTSPYIGMLDDLRVYNYQLSAIDVATMYTQVRTDESVCAVPPAYDFDGDCRVTVADLLYIAGDWLGCGLVPTCTP